MRMEERSAKALGLKPASKVWHQIVVSALHIFGGLAWLSAVLLVVLAYATKSESRLEAAYVPPLVLSSLVSGALLFGLASLITLLLDLRTHAELQTAVTLKRLYDGQGQVQTGKNLNRSVEG